MQITMKDMTTGNPTRLILQFAIPLLISNLFQQLYNLADTRIAGTFLGGHALYQAVHGPALGVGGL